MKKLVKFLQVLITLSVILGLMSCSKKGDTGANFSASALKATGFYEVTDFGSNPGQIKMYAYVPSNMPANAPLVLALHGCTQTASGYHQGSGWSELADKYKFYVIYAEQNSKNNQNSCFNWGGDPNSTLADMDPAGTKRDGDENLSLKQMIQKMQTDFTIDSKRIFVTGLSAGGYMTALMLAVYPDIFAAGAVMAGGPYLCDRTDAGKLDSNEAYKCLSPGKDKDGAYWASMVNFSGYTKPADVKWPKVQIWQGKSDYIVYPMNATEVKQQFLALQGLSETPSVSTTLKGYAYEQYKNASGESLVEVIWIDSMGHGIAVDPGTAEDQGGKAGAFILDTNIHSSYYAAKFFGLIDAPIPPDGKPTVTMISNGGSFNPSEISIKFSATDDKGLSKVEIVENGSTKYTPTLISGDSKSGTYELKITKTAGTYTYKAVVTDADNNSAESSTITYVIEVIVPDESWTAADGSFTGSGSVPSAIYHTPSGISKSSDASLVVYLHGCLESDTIGRDNTGWNTLADKYKFFVMYVKSTGVNQCFDWYSSTAQSGNGDTAAIMNLIKQMKTKYSTSNSEASTKIKKIYVAGLSAGGGMTVILLSLYPNNFAGGAAMSALPFKGFTGAATSTLSYMSGGDKNTPSVWASKMPSNPGTYPPMLEIHGVSDTTVSFSFQNAIVEQWTQVQGADQTADTNKFLSTADNIKGHAYKEFWSADGSKLLIATLSINGMGHGITVDPGTADEQGGKTNTYSFDKDLYCAYWATKFFGLTAPADLSPVVTSISPANGSTQVSSFTVSASATDDKGVTKVEFYVNNVLKSTDFTAPYEYTFNAAEYSNGNYTISAKAYDTINQTDAKSISITLNKPVEEPTVLITEPSNGTKTNTSAILVKANAADNKAVTKVEFYLNNVLKETVYSAPYQSTLNLGVDATYDIKAIAYDADGYTASNQISVTLDQTAPVVSFDKAAGSYDSGVVINFSASEAATFFYTTDGSEPTLSSASGNSVTLTNSNPDAKLITVKAIAKDAAGNVTTISKSETYTVTFSDIAVPVVVITAPTESCFSGFCNPAQITGSINLTGTASDDKTVAKVEVKVYSYKYSYTETNPTLLGTYTASGTTSWSYSVSGLTKYKYYKIEVIATDGAGKTSTVQFVRIFQM